MITNSKRLIAASTLAMVCGIAPAFAAGEHPIDKWTAKASAAAKSTADEVACQDQAFHKWDVELNSQYKKLLAQLTPAERKNLQLAQLAWIKFRDQEFKLIDTLYEKKSGSMFAPMQVASRARIVRDRALLLQHYNELLTEI